MTSPARDLVARIHSLANPEKARILSRFFKTGPGEYGEGDQFWGVTVPQTRAAIREFRAMPLDGMDALLAHPVHEVRLAGWLLLVEKYGRAKESDARSILFEFYRANASRANNWVLVDLSAPQIVGAWLLETNAPERLREFSALPDLWSRRIAVVSTFAFIKAGSFEPTTRLCEELLGTRHDLLHKACGWMLREVGKRGGLTELRTFLEQHHRTMPRTMLRYAIERLDPAERSLWMRRD